MKIGHFAVAFDDLHVPDASGIEAPYSLWDIIEAEASFSIARL
jgi:hypothetical protein